MLQGFILHLQQINRLNNNNPHAFQHIYRHEADKNIWIFRQLSQYLEDVYNVKKQSPPYMPVTLTNDYLGRELKI